MSLYRAKKDLIKGHCEIWEWAAGETAYVCSVNAPNQQIAEHRYEKAVDDISGCLGSSWAGEESERVRDGSPAGVVTRFRNSDQTGLVISIHNVAIAGGKGSARSNYLFIGGVGKANEL
ncbi:MAG: hypothetical protein WD623_00580 [Marinobacter sp.]|uniref:hypothetical protein n=1 Tax=Marinobacter sp. TaxID=50741 RepID=UPI0034A02464